jgi:hypothetical protein
MDPLSVIENLNVVEYLTPGLITCLEITVEDTLTSEDGTKLKSHILSLGT